MLAATTGATGLMLLPTTASAAVACGQTITTSTTLTSDLSCPGNGVFIGASGVVFDLGGHTISGTTTADDQSGFTGVSVVSGRTNVVVRNGTIRGFNRGVAVNPGANGALLTGLTLDGNGMGIGVFGDPVSAPRNVRIVHNTILHTTRFSAMQLSGNGHHVEGNTIANGNGDGIFYAGSDNVITGNTINDPGRGGIRQSSFPSVPGPFANNRIVGNRIAANDRLGPAGAVTVRLGVNTVVSGNVVEGRRTSPGVFVENSSGTSVTQNQLSQNNEGVLVRASSTNTSIVGNNTSGNNVGIRVEAQPSSTLVERNLAAENRFDGINVGSPSATLTGNTAYRNGSFGIRAVAGVVDGGGNRAFLNGAGQCTPNIACV